MPICSADGRVIACLVGRPDDGDYLQLTRRVATKIDSTREDLRLNDGQRSHRRGEFPALAMGLSYGGGQRVSHTICTMMLIILIPLLPQSPGNLVHSKNNRLLLESLLRDADVQRIAGYQSGELPDLVSARGH